jgi:hypothetical protein
MKNLEKHEVAAALTKIKLNELYPIDTPFKTKKQGEQIIKELFDKWYEFYVEVIENAII